MHRELAFEGYWSIPSTGGADWAGVYCVYATVFNTTSYLLYIGESYNVEFRISRHERRGQWIQAANGHPLCYGAARYNIESERQRLEAAMINYHKPPCNEEHKFSFPYPRTSVVTTGNNANLENYFIVYPQ